VTYLDSEKIDGYIAMGRQKHSDKTPAAPQGRIPKNATTRDKMARKLRTQKGRATCSKRKQIVEPVFGQIKEARGFRRFSLRDIRCKGPKKDFFDTVKLSQRETVTLF